MDATDALAAAVKLRSAVRRARSTISRPRHTTPADRWNAYLSEVEPALAGQVRVHRFARPPVQGDPHASPQSLAVWIEGDDASAVARTRGALDGGTVRPAAVLQGAVADALSGNQAERMLLIRAGDTPAPLALERFGQAAALAPDAAVITCDDDELDGDEARSCPRFRPGPSPIAGWPVTTAGR